MPKQLKQNRNECAELIKVCAVLNCQLGEKVSAGSNQKRSICALTGMRRRIQTDEEGGTVSI